MRDRRALGQVIGPEGVVPVAVGACPSRGRDTQHTAHPPKAGLVSAGQAPGASKS